MARIHAGDLVKIIAGKDKGTTGKVLRVDTKENTVLVEGVGVGGEDRPVGVVQGDNHGAFVLQRSSQRAGQGNQKQEQIQSRHLGLSGARPRA